MEWPCLALPVIEEALLLVLLVIVFLKRAFRGKVLLILAVATLAATPWFDIVRELYMQGVFSGDPAIAFALRWIQWIGNPLAAALLIAFALRLRTAPCAAPAPVGAAPRDLMLPNLKPTRFSYIVALLVLETLGLVALVATVLAAQAYRISDNLGVGLILLFGAWVLACLVLQVVVIAIYLHRAWRIVQSESAVTPGKAVGLLFVPLFNLYWCFPAYYGWARAYNRLRSAHDLSDAPRVSEGLFLSFCILLIIGAIPVIGLAVCLPLIVVSLCALRQLCAAVNYVARAGERNNETPQELEAQ